MDSGPVAARSEVGVWHWAALSPGPGHAVAGEAGHVGSTFAELLAWESLGQPGIWVLRDWPNLRTTGDPNHVYFSFFRITTQHQRHAETKKYIKYAATYIQFMTLTSHASHCSRTSRLRLDPWALARRHRHPRAPRASTASACGGLAAHRWRCQEGHHLRPS